MTYTYTYTKTLPLNIHSREEKTGGGQARVLSLTHSHSLSFSLSLSLSLERALSLSPAYVDRVRAKISPTMAPGRRFRRGLMGAMAVAGQLIGAAAFSPAMLAGSSFLRRSWFSPGLAHVAGGRRPSPSPSPSPFPGAPIWSKDVATKAGRRVRGQDRVRGVDIWLQGSLWDLGTAKGDAGLGADVVLTDLVVVFGLMVAAVKAFESRLKFRLGISSGVILSKLQVAVSCDSRGSLVSKVFYTVRFI
jgi:hypothetical protein